MMFKTDGFQGVARQSAHVVPQDDDLDGRSLNEFDNNAA
jgi:hypothetical protein